MSRATKFGLGTAILLTGLLLFISVYCENEVSNMVAAIIFGALFVFPGATLLAKAFWPSDKK
jgi:hypothetical protein